MLQGDRTEEDLIHFAETGKSIEKPKEEPFYVDTGGLWLDVQCAERATSVGFWKLHEKILPGDEV